MLQVAISIEDDNWQTLATDIEETCQRALQDAWSHIDLKQSGQPQDAWVSVLLADDRQLQDLNRQFRDQDKPTNVLSFPAAPSGLNVGPNGEDTVILGDIALSSDTIARESVAQNKDILRHLTHLLVHGLLHLLGYDHENDADATVMEQLEIDILGKMQIPNPYEQV